MAALALVAATAGGSCGTVGRHDGKDGGGAGGDTVMIGTDGGDAAGAIGGAGGSDGGGAGGAPMNPRFLVRGAIGPLGGNAIPGIGPVRLMNQRVSLANAPTCVGAICLNGGINP